MTLWKWKSCSSHLDSVPHFEISQNKPTSFTQFYRWQPSFPQASLLFTMPLLLGDPPLDFLSKDLQRLFSLKLPIDQDRLRRIIWGACLSAQEPQGSRKPSTGRENSLFPVSLGKRHLTKPPAFVSHAKKITSEERAIWMSPDVSLKTTTRHNI